MVHLIISRFFVIVRHCRSTCHDNDLFNKKKSPFKKLFESRI